MGDDVTAGDHPMVDTFDQTARRQEKRGVFR
jgi:hypothetical protein